MFVGARVPDFAGRLFSDRVGIASLYELNALRRRLIDVWRNEDVDVIGHDHKGMEEKATGVAIAEECGDEKFGVQRPLEVAMLLECRYCYGVGFELLADRGHDRRAYPRG